LLLSLPTPPIPMDSHAHQLPPAPSSSETLMVALLHVPAAYLTFLARSLAGCGATSRSCFSPRRTSPGQAPPPARFGRSLSSVLSRGEGQRARAARGERRGRRAPGRAPAASSLNTG
jgi:hypothetical protein